MNTIFALALLALAVWDCVASAGQGIWAVPLVIVVAGCSFAAYRSGDKWSLIFHA